MSDHNPLHPSEEVEEKNISVRLSYYEMGPKVNKRRPRQTQYTQFKTHETYQLLKISSIVSMSVIHKFKLEEKRFPQDLLRNITVYFSLSINPLIPIRTSIEVTVKLTNF